MGYSSHIAYASEPRRRACTPTLLPTLVRGSHTSCFPSLLAVYMQWVKPLLYYKSWFLGVAHSYKLT